MVKKKDDLHLFHLSGEIDAESSKELITSLLECSIENPDDSITLFINSGGGDLYCAFAMYDVIKKIPNPVRTVGIGCVMSAAILLLVAGDTREASENTSIMIHEPVYSLEEYSYYDMLKEVEHFSHLRKKMVEIISVNIEKSMKKIMSDLKKGDFFLTASEAIDYGIIDKIY